MVYNELPVQVTKEQLLIEQSQKDVPTIAQAIKDYQDFELESAFDFVYKFYYPKIIFMVNKSNINNANKEDLLGEMLMKFSMIIKSYIPSVISFTTYFYFCLNNVIKAFNVKANAKKRSLCSVVSMNNFNATLDNEEEYDIADKSADNAIELVEANHILAHTIFKQLSPKWREVINLMVQGYSYTDICKIKHINRNALSAKICALRKTPSFQNLKTMLMTASY